MWHLIPTILYLTYSEAQQVPRLVLPHITGRPPVLLSNSGRSSIPAAAYPVPPLVVHNVPGSLANLVPKSYAAYRSDYPYVDHTKDIHSAVDPYYHAENQNHLHRVGQSRVGVADIEGHPFDFDHSSETNADSKSLFDQHSYSADLELVENFGRYLKRRTQLSESSSINDPAHQYNALLAVLVALATVVRNACTDFDKVYDKAYLKTVENYYKYSLNNAEQVAVMIDDYIRKGNRHIAKLNKLKEETCQKELFCSAIVDNKIKSSGLILVKELETLEALSHLARSYYQYIEEFNEAAQDGEVLLYLQNNKDRLKEYVMHIVNSVEHVSDDVVRCPLTMK